jgi:serine protease Do
MPPELEELFRRFNEQQGGGGYAPKEARSLGSGFIISADGYVLTNHHVVKDASEIMVKLNDRRELVAKLIGSDARTDVALLKIEARDLPIVTIGAPDKLQVGEWVLAIGSPFGFDQSVTAGIVSAKGRSLPGGNYVPFIQTDVAINPGNSGGPLFNMEGKVVGINSQIYSRTGGSMGLSFAIPMDVVMNIVEQIKVKGKASHGWLGVQIQDVTRELAESFGMKKPQGALVAKVIAAGPAEQAGVQIGDIITEFNGQLIDHSADLPPMVGITPINNDATLKIIRQGENRTLHFNVGLLPDEEDKLAAAKSPNKSPENQLGITVSELTGEQRQLLQIPKNGVLVQDVAKGASRDAGLQRGDVILRIQNTIVRDLNDFDKIVKKLPTGISIAVLIQRQGNPVFLALKLK